MVQGEMFELVLGMNKVHALSNMVGHLAIVIRRSHREGTLTVKKKRDGSGMIRVSMMDFVEKHVEMRGGHGSSASGVVLGFSLAHGNWSGKKSALVDDTTLTENKETSSAATCVGVILPARASENDEAVHVGNSGSNKHLMDGSIGHLVVELETMAGIVVETHKKMNSHLAVTPARVSGEFTELSHCVENAGRSVGEKKCRANK